MTEGHDGLIYGVVDGTSILETKLSVYWFDTADGQWMRCLSEEIHTDENYIK